MIIIIIIVMEKWLKIIDSKLMIIRGFMQNNLTKNVFHIIWWLWVGLTLSSSDLSDDESWDCAGHTFFLQ